MTLTAFLSARIAEDEAVARDAHEQWLRDPTATDVDGWYANNADSNGDPIVAVSPARALAESAAKRAIVSFHDRWPVLVETRPQLNDAGGDEPPTAPLLLELAAVYATHPDFDPAWRTA